MEIKDLNHNLLNVKIKFLSPMASLPIYATDGSMGMDMRAISVEYDEKIDCYYYHTGLAFEIPEEYGMLLFPRSSNRKTDFYLTNGVGIGDSDYRGEIIFCYKSRISTYERMEIIANKNIINSIEEIKNENINKDDLINIMLDRVSVKKRVLEMTKNLEFAPYKVGDKIGQLVIMPYPKIKFDIVNELNNTERGNGAFGSTGK